MRSRPSALAGYSSPAQAESSSSKGNALLEHLGSADFMTIICTQTERPTQCLQQIVQREKQNTNNPRASTQILVPVIVSFCFHYCGLLLVLNHLEEKKKINKTPAGDTSSN